MYIAMEDFYERMIADKRPVFQYDLDGHFIKRWENIKDAEKGLNLRHIKDVCDGSRDQVGGFAFTYGTRGRLDIDSRPRRVAQYDKSGKLIKIHESINAAIRAVRGDKADLFHVCKGERKTHRGFIWKFVDER